MRILVVEDDAALASYLVKACSQSTMLWMSRWMESRARACIRRGL